MNETRGCNKCRTIWRAAARTLHRSDNRAIVKLRADFLQQAPNTIFCDLLQKSSGMKSYFQPDVQSVAVGCLFSEANSGSFCCCCMQIWMCDCCSKSGCKARWDCCWENEKMDEENGRRLRQMYLRRSALASAFFSPMHSGDNILATGGNQSQRLGFPFGST